MTEVIKLGENFFGLALNLIGEFLNKVGPAERVGYVGHVGFVRDHLLGAQSNAGRLLGGQR